MVTKKEIFLIGIIAIMLAGAIAIVIWDEFLKDETIDIPLDDPVYEPYDERDLDDLFTDTSDLDILFPGDYTSKEPKLYVRQALKEAPESSKSSYGPDYIGGRVAMYYPKTGRNITMNIMKCKDALGCLEVTIPDLRRISEVSKINVGDLEMVRSIYPSAGASSLTYLYPKKDILFIFQMDHYNNETIMKDFVQAAMQIR